MKSLQTALVPQAAVILFLPQPYSRASWQQGSRWAHSQDQTQNNTISQPVWNRNRSWHWHAKQAALKEGKSKKTSRKRAQFEMQAQVSRKGGRGGCKRREKYVIGNNPSKTPKQISWIDAVNTIFWIFSFQPNLRSLWLCVTFICSFNSQTNPLSHFFT